MISLEEFENLHNGDKVVLVGEEQMRLSIGSINDNMYEFANEIVTVKEKGTGSNQLHYIKIYEDGDVFGHYFWWLDLIDHIAEQVDYSSEDYAEIPLPENAQTKAVLTFDADVFGLSYIRDFYLAKLPDVQALINGGNSPKIARILANKYVVTRYGDRRVLRDYNPHLASFIEDDSGLRIGSRVGIGWTDRICNDMRYYVVKEVDFINGTVKDAELEGVELCSSCGRPMDTHNRIGKYCKNCLTKDGGFAYRFGYHCYSGGYRLNETVDTRKELVFGCEIERDYDSDTDGQFGNNMRKACLQILQDMQGDQLENGTLVRDNVFMCDGSLTNDGIEWITFPHTLSWYIKNKDKINNALENIKQYGFCATSRAGNHIHINRDYFKDKNGEDESDFVACKMAIVVNKYWTEFLHLAKRENTHYTTKPSQTDKDSLFKAVEKTINDKGDHSVAVNLQHSASVEVRLWSAIENADDLLFYIDTEQALARYCYKHSFEKVQACSITDFMKYYKLKSSLKIAQERLDQYGTKESAKLVQKMIEKKGENR